MGVAANDRPNRMAPLRIGIDGACLSNRRGFGRFAREVTAALARIRGPHELIVFLDEPSAAEAKIPEGAEPVVVTMSQAPARAASARGRRRLGDMLAMSRGIARSRLDVVYFPATYSFVPVWNGPRVVCTMHDTLPFTHPEMVFPTRAGRLSWTLKERYALWRSDHIVTVSEASRRDLMSRFGLSRDRVTVVVEGVDSMFRPGGSDRGRHLAVLERCGLSPDVRYFLYVGGLSPHKNLLRLLDAFARLEPMSSGALVIVGDTQDVFHSHVPELRARVCDLGLESRVRFAGYVADNDLVGLYEHAYAFVQPSLLEGFGLPAAEAMACGTPVLYSQAGSLPEVVGDAGLAFDPRDSQSIAASLKSLLDSPRDRDHLSRIALERSSRFRWDHTAEVLLATLVSTVSH